jgi:hypothetical protein
MLSMIEEVSRISRQGMGTGAFVPNGAIEAFDESLRTAVRLKIPRQKKCHIWQRVPENDAERIVPVALVLGPGAIHFHYLPS